MNFWSSEGMEQRAQSKARFSSVESRHASIKSMPLCLHIWLSRDKSHDKTK